MLASEGLLLKPVFFFCALNLVWSLEAMSEKQQLTSPNLLLASLRIERTEEENEEIINPKKQHRIGNLCFLALAARPSSRDGLVAVVLLEPARYDPRLLGPHPRQPLGVVLAGEPQIHVVRA